MSEEQSTAELIKLLGMGGFIRLVEGFGGTRPYIPASGQTALEKALGPCVAELLISRYAGTYIRVPLARELRARHYRAEGKSNAGIARRLGLTETGVEKMFKRMVNKPIKGSGDPRQPDLFLSRR